MKTLRRAWLTAGIMALIAANTVVPVVLGLPNNRFIIDDDPIIKPSVTPETVPYASDHVKILEKTPTTNGLSSAGAVIVNDRLGLVSELEAAGEGEKVIYIADDAVIDLTGDVVLGSIR